MNVFFDVDYTLIDGDGNLRPGVKEIFARLTEKGHVIFLWSGLGPRQEIVERHNLEEWVSDCFHKPLHQHRRMLGPLGIHLHPDFVVDDHEDLVYVFGGTVVEPYLAPDPDDNEMARVLAEIADRE